MSARGKRTPWPAGRVVRVGFDSSVLKDNPLGDPSEREVAVWLPPDYDGSKKRLPLLIDLVGYTGSGQAHVNWNAFDENVPERLDRLYHEGKIGSCIVAFPDCFTALGGNQYINSSAIGRYADYLTRELIPFLDGEFRTKAAREHRGCFGKSSGGYGALVHGMRYAEHWGAIASHSGDAGFDLIYGTEWPGALTHLSAYTARPRKDGAYRLPGKRLKPGYDDGRVRRFLDAFAEKPRPSGGDVMCLMMVAMAATYDPDPTAPNGFRIPHDLESGERIETRWQRWLRHDPVEMIASYKAKTHRANLKRLRGIYIDCGWRDQYHIHFGSRRLSALLHNHNVKHRYLEFNGTHSGVDHRMDHSLPFLYRALR